MSTPNYNDTALVPTYTFGNMQDIHTQLVNNLITDSTDGAISNFVHLNNTGGQIITTPIQLNPTDGDPDDNTTSNANERRVATRRWCKNAYITNVMDPHIQGTDCTFTGDHVHTGDVRMTSDPTLNNSLCRKLYVVNNFQPILSGTSSITVGNISSASLTDNGNLTCGGTVTCNGHLYANSGLDVAGTTTLGAVNLNGNIVAATKVVTATQVSYLTSLTSDVQIQLNGKQSAISGSTALTCGTLTTASLVDNGSATFSNTVTFKPT